MSTKREMVNSNRMNRKNNQATYEENYEIAANV